MISMHGSLSFFCTVMYEKASFIIFICLFISSNYFLEKFWPVDLQDVQKMLK